MYAPDKYNCPFCKLVSGDYGSRENEIIFESNEVIVFPAKHHKKGNEGNLLVVPKQHIENLYQLPLNLAEPILEATQKAAVVLKAALQCDGISIRQHNEPAGGQDVWHYHVHVIPRYTDDTFQVSSHELVSDEERLKMAMRLRAAVT